MFEQFSETPQDPILYLSTLFNEDLREDKIDVGVGVFRNELGQTPIMQAVKAAEKRLYNSQVTKGYVGSLGDAVFNQQIAKLVFADSVNMQRVCAVQALGGTGALALCAKTLHNNMADKTVWVSEQTWGNHFSIFKTAGFKVKTYPYFNPETKMVDEDRMLEALLQLGADDIVLLHGCCHNPTGSDISKAGWDRLAEIAVERGFLPFVDLAYQGFGDGLEEDLYGTRKLAASVSELIVTSSCSKNFGIYRERVGCALIMANSQNISAVKTHLSATARSLYSMPADHGANTVGIILSNPELYSLWEEELTTMRNRIIQLRQQLVNQLSEASDSNNWDFINNHRGMFSLLCLDKQQTETLREKYGIYMVNGGRINIAGLKDEEQVKRFAQCLVKVTR